MKDWLLIDGYNVINSWSEFQQIKDESLEHAREQLKEKLKEYLPYKNLYGTVVFDAQDVPGEMVLEEEGGLEIVFTGEGETADSWIERRVYSLTRNGINVFVVTSDYAEQLNILGSGAYRISAREFREEYLEAKKEIAEHNKKIAGNLGRNELGGRLDGDVLEHFEKMRRKP